MGFFRFKNDGCFCFFFFALELVFLYLFLDVSHEKLPRIEMLPTSCCFFGEKKWEKGSPLLTRFAVGLQPPSKYRCIPHTSKDLLSSKPSQPASQYKSY